MIVYMTVQTRIKKLKQNNKNTIQTSSIPILKYPHILTFYLPVQIETSNRQVSHLNQTRNQKYNNQQYIQRHHIRLSLRLTLITAPCLMAVFERKKGFYCQKLSPPPQGTLGNYRQELPFLYYNKNNGDSPLPFFGGN